MKRHTRVVSIIGNLVLLSTGACHTHKLSISQSVCINVTLRLVKFYLKNKEREIVKDEKRLEGVEYVRLK